MKEKITTEDLYVRMAVKESRGEGDNITIPIDNRDDVVFGERYITIRDSENQMYMFSLHNILYFKIFAKVDFKVGGDNTSSVPTAKGRI